MPTISRIADPCVSATVALVLLRHSSRASATSALALAGAPDQLLLDNPFRAERCEIAKKTAVPSRAGPMVRIRLPPAGSQRRTIRP